MSYEDELSGNHLITNKKLNKTIAAANTTTTTATTTTNGIVG